MGVQDANFTYVSLMQHQKPCTVQTQLMLRPARASHTDCDGVTMTFQVHNRKLDKSVICVLICRLLVVAMIFLLARSGFGIKREQSPL